MISMGFAASEAHAFLASANDHQLPQKASVAFDRLNIAMEKADLVLKEMISKSLVSRLSTASDSAHRFFTSYEEISHDLKAGQGTLGKLLTNESSYLLINSTLTRLEATLSDINRYGIFYQFNSKWQRNRRLQERRTRSMQSPTALCNFLNAELYNLNQTLDCFKQALEYADPCATSIHDPCLLQPFQDLLNKTQMLYEIYINIIKIYNKINSKKCYYN